VAGFGAISAYNRLYVIQEWVAEGLTLVFVGVLAGLITWQGGPANPTGALVLRACAAMALVIGLWTAVTGSRTPVLPFKLCPVLMAVAAVCLALPTYI
jgi:hypothetical protein